MKIIVRQLCKHDWVDYPAHYYDGGDTVCSKCGMSKYYNWDGIFYLIFFMAILKCGIFVLPLLFLFAILLEWILFK